MSNDDPRVDGLLDHGDWEPDDLGYGNPNIFICTEYGCSGCGARNCPTSYSIVDLDTGTVLGTNIAIVPSRFITENELSNDSAAISAAKEYGYVLYANLDERITS